MHVHVSALEALSVLCYMIILGFFWRTLSVKWSDNVVGQAMSFIY